MKYNFSAGPSILPQKVLKQASEGVLNFNGSGLSILEISHRSDGFMQVMDEAVALVKELLKIPDGYEVLFLSGGASTQFFMSTLNLLGSEETAGYINTGTWSSKAIKEAKLQGEIIEIATSADNNFSYIPKKYRVPKKTKYVHYTSNNTIYGTQFHHMPDVSGLPLVADMSSDIFSGSLDINLFYCIYAGAQKNMGPAGTTLVIIKKSAIRSNLDGIPSMLSYQKHIDKGSMFNTPPVFPIYVSMLTLRWLKNEGGVEEIYKRNEAKSKSLYKEIDSNPLFYGSVNKDDRSKMNITFMLKDQQHEDSFNKKCVENGLVGLKGHRSVGGFRASIYNAMEIKGVEVLIDVMQEIAHKYA